VKYICLTTSDTMGYSFSTSI